MHIKLLHIIAVACGCLLDPSRAHDATEYGCEDLVVAGGGTGGLYSAWRMIEAGLVDPNKTCIFEQTQRLASSQLFFAPGPHLEAIPADPGSLSHLEARRCYRRAWPATRVA